MDADHEPADRETEDDEADVLAAWMELPPLPLPPRFSRTQYEQVMANLFGTPVSLRTWLAARSRSRLEVLALFEIAGRELDAAYDRGRAPGFGLDDVRVLSDGGVELGPEPAGPRSSRDVQPQFCATLWEVLYGERPTSGGPQPPSERWIPSWIHQALVRGLRSDPAQRFDSMSDLLEALCGPRAIT